MGIKSEVQCLLHSWGTVFCSGLQIRRWWCAHLRRPLGNFTLLIKQSTSIPLFCNKTGRDAAVRKQYKITSAIRRTLGAGYDDVTASFIFQWGVIPNAGGCHSLLSGRGTQYLSSVCRPFARTTKKSPLSAPWNTCPTVALMAKPTPTDVLSATPTCTYRSETFPFMINSCTCCECRAVSSWLFCLAACGIYWTFLVFLHCKRK